MERKLNTHSSLRNKMDFERVLNMKVEELQDFLGLRGLKVNGMKEELGGESICGH